MKARTTLLLLIGVAVLGGFIWFFERHTEDTESAQEKAKQVFRIEPERVDAVRFIRGDLDVTCAKSGDAWSIVDPVKARADEGEIERILWGLKAIERADVITPRQQRVEDLHVAQFGLINPRAQLILGNGQSQRIFKIGRDTPLGGQVYVQEAGAEQILVTSSKLLSLVPENLDALRNRRLFDGGAYDVTKVEIQGSGGFLQLERDEANAWTIQQPYQARADASAIRKLLNALFQARIAQFVADDFSDPAAYGFQENAPRITLRREREHKEQSLRLGSGVEDAPDQVYAKHAEYKTVYTVSNSVLEAINVKADDLRDRRLLTFPPESVDYIEITKGETSLAITKNEAGSWRLTRPVTHAAEDAQVKALLDAWTGARIEAFHEPGTTNLAAVTSPAGVLQVRFARKAATRPADAAAGAPSEVAREDLAVLSLKTAESGAAEVKIAGEKWIYEVDNAYLSHISLDPLYYRDRSVLQLDKADVRTILVVNGSREQRVARGEDGVFHPVSDETASVDQDAVDDLLGLVTHLRAERFVEKDPPDLAAFGLDAPSCTLTLGLTGTSGIEKSVLVGRVASAGGVYAVIRGEDLVFILDQAYAGVLRRDLYAPLPQE